VTGQDLINALINHYDQTLSTDAGNTNRRTFMLHHIQMVVDEVWNHRAWSFKMNQESITTSGGSSAPPTSFARVGPEGFVYEPSTKKTWTETFAQDIMAIRNSATTFTMKLYAISSVDNTGRQIIVPDVTNPVTLSFFYEMAPPVIADDSTDIVQIPVEYHNTVLLAGGVSRIQTSKNDIRLYWEKQYLQGLGRMVANDLPLSSRMKQMPLSVGKRMW
jgi:hypothetical protein